MLLITLTTSLMSPSIPNYSESNVIVFKGLASINYGSEMASPVYFLPTSIPSTLALGSNCLIYRNLLLISLCVKNFTIIIINRTHNCWHCYDYNN